MLCTGEGLKTDYEWLCACVCVINGYSWLRTGSAVFTQIYKNNNISEQKIWYALTNWCLICIEWYNHCIKGWNIFVLFMNMMMVLLSGIHTLCTQSAESYHGLTSVKLLTVTQKNWANFPPVWKRSRGTHPECYVDSTESWPTLSSFLYPLPVKTAYTSSTSSSPMQK